MSFTSESAANFDTIWMHAEQSVHVYIDQLVVGGPQTAAPTASFDYSPSAPTPGETVTFDASNSTDDGSIASYEWDFDGDGQVDATGEVVTHTFDTAGDYQVTLTVSDTAGATDTTTQVITVEQGAFVTFENQTTGGDSVVVRSVTLSEGGFVVIHNASGAVLGHSVYLTAGTHVNVRVNLSTSISADQTLVAMAHRDTDDNQMYDFPEADGPYVTAAGAPVTDSAMMTIETGPPAISDVLEAPTNVDDDNKFEDINGNGRFDIGDIQSLFANRNTDTVQNNVDAFDFNNNGRIDIGDIQSLFIEYVNR